MMIDDDNFNNWAQIKKQIIFKKLEIRDHIQEVNILIGLIQVLLKKPKVFVI